jgi:cellulose synthase/poly-beta-1,6-N-acetylglucosamine synthase-like glycosyltransferase
VGEIQSTNKVVVRNDTDLYEVAEDTEQYTGVLILWLIISTLLNIIYSFLQKIYYKCFPIKPPKKISLSPQKKEELVREDTNHGSDRRGEFKGTNRSEGKTSVAVIIPVRNEAQNMEQLLNALIKQNYPKILMEIIVVDDFSEDNTVSLAQNILNQTDIKHQILHLNDFVHEKLNAYKKKAISIAVEHTEQELIVTTDADCNMPENWLRSVVQFYETTNANLIASPVLFKTEKKSDAFSRFQILDFCGMQLITASCLQSGIFNMANGANLAYKRSAFVQVNGYEGIDHKASGDDMFLVYKIAQLDRTKIFFNKNPNAVVRSNIAGSLKDFIQQRFRWTSKAAHYQDKRMTAMLGILLLFCVSLVINFILTVVVSIFPVSPPLGGWGALGALALFIIQFLVKSVTDYILLNAASSFFNEKKQLKGFLISELYHIAYIVFIGILGNFISFEWKERRGR